jgi:hypothetical protein
MAKYQQQSFTKCKQLLSVSALDMTDLGTDAQASEYHYKNLKAF